MFDYYLAGFFDAEGSLILGIVPDKRYKNGFQIKPKMNITQKDKNVLLKIQKHLKMGKIYFHKRDQIWYYNVNKFKDIQNFLCLLEGKVIVKKEKFQKFKTCIEMMVNKEHLKPDGLKKIRMIWFTPETDANT